jgi:hypothetical protein
MKKNYNAPVLKKDRGRMTKYKQITIYNVQNYIPGGIRASMHPCIHAISFQLTSFSHLPIFSASQLPSLSPGRRRQNNIIEI